jgi:hypothetical protein
VESVLNRPGIHPTCCTHQALAINLMKTYQSGI